MDARAVQRDGTAVLGHRPHEPSAAAVLDAMPDPVVVVDDAARLRWANAAAGRRLGFTLDELAGATVDHLVHPDDHFTALASLVSVQGKEEGTPIELRIRDATGRYVWFEVRGRTFADGEGSPLVVLNLRETTARRRWEVGAGDPAMLGALVDAAPGLLLVLDPDGRIRSANRALSRLLGVSIEESLGRPLAELAAPHDRAAVARELAAAAAQPGPRSFEATFGSGPSGEVALGVTVVNLLADDAIGGFLVSANDIGALAATRAQLRHLATHDDLTALPNRAWLHEHLDALVARSGAAAAGTLLFGDIDGLKQVNDTGGHRAGDAVIVEVARRLRGCVRADDVVTRLGGDEFVLVVTGTHAHVVDDIRNRIAGALAAPIRLPGGRSVAVGMSLGARTIDPGVDVDALLAEADAAMYADKRTRTRARS